jgi:hypothetical protein
MRGLGMLAAVALVTAAGLAGGPALAAASHPAKVPAVNADTPCVGLAGARPRIRHVIVLFMENQPYKDIIGNPDAAYANGLARRCGLATNYHNITSICPGVPGRDVRQPGRRR